MHTRLDRIVLATALLAASTWAGDDVRAEDDVRRMVEESRKASAALLTQIRSELVKELEASGPLKAIIVCKYVAPEISSSVSRRNGWRVTRVSLRPRNPALGAADPWEQRVLMDFEQRMARGEKAESLEHHEIVAEPAGRQFRYLRAIPMAPACTSCHGDNITEAVKAQLNAEYPFDRGTGYVPGQLRGAVTIKRPL